MTTQEKEMPDRINLKEVLYVTFAGSFTLSVGLAIVHNHVEIVQTLCGIACFIAFCACAYKLGNHFALPRLSDTLQRNEFPRIASSGIIVIFCLTFGILILLSLKSTLAFTCSTFLLLNASFESFRIGRYFPFEKKDRLIEGPEDGYSEYPCENLPKLTLKLSFIPILGILFFYLFAIPTIIALKIYKFKESGPLLLGLFISCLNLTLTYIVFIAIKNWMKHT